MVLETHLHSLNGSYCGKHDFAEILDWYKQKKYGGIVLTEHFSALIMQNFMQETDYNKAAKRYILNFENFKKQADNADIKAFFGCELSYYFANGTYIDYLLYGITPEFFENKRLLKLGAQELFDYCRKMGVYVCQAHPFRDNVWLPPPGCLHAVEVYNGNFGHANRNEKALKYAVENDLNALSGSDFHRREHLAAGGIIIPETIESGAGLVDYLKNNRPRLIKDGIAQ